MFKKYYFFMISRDPPPGVRIINEGQIPSVVIFVRLTRPGVETPLDAEYLVIARDGISGKLIPQYGGRWELEYEGHTYLRDS